MELFLLRHGHSEFHAAADHLRELSPHGRSEVQKVAEEHKLLLSGVDCLLVSPYLRAKQTAQIVQNILGEVPVCESDLLVPQTNPDDLIGYLGSYYSEHAVKSVLLVGHLPLLGLVLNALCGAEPGEYSFATASIAAIDVEVLATECCQLRWLHHSVQIP